MKLSAEQLAILRALDGGPEETGIIAIFANVSGYSVGARNRKARNLLLELKYHGFVEYADSEKPWIWQRTEAGTAAIAGSPTQRQPRRKA